MKSCWFPFAFYGSFHAFMLVFHVIALWTEGGEFPLAKPAQMPNWGKGTSAPYHTLVVHLAAEHPLKPQPLFNLTKLNNKPSVSLCLWTLRLGHCHLIINSIYLTLSVCMYVFIFNSTFWPHTMEVKCKQTIQKGNSLLSNSVWGSPRLIGTLYPDGSSDSSSSMRSSWESGGGSGTCWDWHMFRKTFFWSGRVQVLAQSPERGADRRLYACHHNSHSQYAHSD